MTTGLEARLEASWAAPAAAAGPAKRARDGAAGPPGPSAAAAGPGRRPSKRARPAEPTPGVRAFAATRFPSGFVLEAGLAAGPAAGPAPCPGGGGFRVPFHYAVDWEAAEPPSRGFADLAAYFRRQAARGAPLDARSAAPRNPFRGWQRLDGAGVAGAFAEAGVRVLGLADAGGGLACVRPAEGRVFPSGVSYLFEGALLLPVQLAGLCVRVVAGPSFYGPGDEEICAAVASVLRQARQEHPGLFAPADAGRAEVAWAGRQVARSVARIRSRSVAPALWSHVYQQCGARTDEEFAEMLAAAIYHRA